MCLFCVSLRGEAIAKFPFPIFVFLPSTALIGEKLTRSGLTVTCLRVSGTVFPVYGGMSVLCLHLLCLAGSGPA